MSASAATSPFASIVNFWFRLPSATAVTTFAMPRTWVVRFDAMKLTLSVRSFQVPLTPLTVAWPPSFPSVPTSRATRVTSSANERSWSTIVLIVFLSSRTSPLTSTVIFLLRSPFATAVVTSAMFRTCVVRLFAMKLTLSVRSRQIPDTSLTVACPPRMPSVPTSRATRVTSDANELSWSSIVFTVVPMRRNSPRTGCPSILRAIFCDRSPSATASRTRETSMVGRTRWSIIELTELIDSAHVPFEFFNCARSFIRPSRPMTLLMRLSSPVRPSRRSDKPLNALATSPMTPLFSRDSRTPVSPSLAERRASSSSCRSFFLISTVAPSVARRFVAGARLGALRFLVSGAATATPLCEGWVRRRTVGRRVCRLCAESIRPRGRKSYSCAGKLPGISRA